PAPYPLSLHDALPISARTRPGATASVKTRAAQKRVGVTDMLDSMPQRRVARQASRTYRALTPSLCGRARIASRFDQEIVSAAASDRKSTRLNSSHLGI